MIVKFRQSAALSAVTGRIATSVAALMRRMGVVAAAPAFAGIPSVTNALDRIYKITLPDTADVLSAVAAFAADPNVEYAEPDYLVGLADTGLGSDRQIPSDSLFDEQWGLHNTGQAGGRADADIDAPEAWTITTGSSDVMIAIVDTGVDYNHPELNDGRVRTDIDKDFFNNDDDAMDDNKHGTLLAGIIAAQSDNHAGVAGVMWRAQILPVKVLSGRGLGFNSTIAHGIIYAASVGARVINLSLGGLLCSKTMAEAINYAYFTKGALIVAAAGNNSGGLLYPAKFEQVVAVGAVDRSGARPTFPNFGGRLDVVAPGVDIISTLLGRGIPQLQRYVAGDSLCCWRGRAAARAAASTEQPTAGRNPARVGRRSRAAWVRHQLWLWASQRTPGTAHANAHPADERHGQMQQLCCERSHDRLAI